MSARRLLRIGLVGTAITALCCFTPVLVVALGALGLSALASRLDVVLLPLLAFFVLLTIVAFLRRRNRRTS